jgi:hypothetical protein
MFDDDAISGSLPAPARARAPETRWSQQADLDAARERVEAGPGGDVYADRRLVRTGRVYVPGLKRTVSIWLRLYEQVQRGELGGPHDGAALPVEVGPRTPSDSRTI